MSVSDKSGETKKDKLFHSRTNTNTHQCIFLDTLGFDGIVVKGPISFPNVSDKVLFDFLDITEGGER